MADLRELGLRQPLIAACSALVANPAPRDPRHGRGKPGFPDRWLARDSLGFLCQAGQTQRFAFAADRLACLCGPAGTVPVATIQTLSFILDPFTAEREFIRFAILDSEATSALSAPRAPDGLSVSIATWLRTRLG
jgi:hypothetical protein